MPAISFFTRLLDDVSPAERFRLATEQIRHAERFGYTRAWVAQHHFHAREGGLPSPYVFLAHAAAHTTSIRLSPGIVTLTLEDPVRVAEDAIVADLLSGGRVDLGVGSGTNPNSFVPFGVQPARKTEVYQEKLATLLTALAGEDVGAGNTVYPPAGSLRERVWQATFNVYGGTSAGAHRNGLLLSRTQPRPDDRPDALLSDLQEPIVDAYLEALPTDAARRVTASRTVFVADSREEALRHAEAGLRRVAEHFGRSGRDLDLSSPAALARSLDSHVGVPEDVAESLAADRTLDRVDEVTIQVHSVDAPHDLILRSIELFATEVAPALGWADAPITLTAGGRA